MYTGITQGLFEVVIVDAAPGLTTYTVQLNPTLCAGLIPGASVAVDGVCQTVIKLDSDHRVTFQAMAETLARTTLDALHVGRQVSIERSAKQGDEVGGHASAGHVLETASVVGREHSENNLCLTLQVSSAGCEYLVDKGFVTLDGSSLTVCEVDDRLAQFRVYLIPHTLAATNFGKREIGDRINVEYDANAVLIAQMLKRYLAKAN